jgi:molybdate transport system substrate-binding protein
MSTYKLFGCQANRLNRCTTLRRMLLSLALLSSSLGFGVQAAEITVSAAASLTNAFKEIGKAYTKLNADTRVLFNFGASGQLVQQLSRGAPVDVLATADLESMDRAESQRLIQPSSRANFAANSLIVVVPGDSPLQLGTLADLAKPQVQRIALGTSESVPAGRYAKAALEKAGLWEELKPRFIYTQNVRQSLDYVFRGEVDAGFVYMTDAAVSPVKVRTALEVAVDRPILYPIAKTKGFGNERRALDFIAFVRSPAGQAILAKYGFLPPGD